LEGKAGSFNATYVSRIVTKDQNFNLEASCLTGFGCSFQGIAEHDSSAVQELFCSRKLSFQNTDLIDREKSGCAFLCISKVLTITSNQQGYVVSE